MLWSTRAKTDEIKADVETKLIQWFCLPTALFSSDFFKKRF